jgi:hypothetical protein
MPQILGAPYALRANPSLRSRVLRLLDIGTRLPIIDDVGFVCRRDLTDLEHHSRAAPLGHHLRGRLKHPGERFHPRSQSARGLRRWLGRRTCQPGSSACCNGRRPMSGGYVAQNSEAIRNCTRSSHTAIPLFQEDGLTDNFRSASSEWRTSSGSPLPRWTTFISHS